MDTNFNKIDISQESLFTLFSQASVALALLKGEDMLIELVNPQMLEILGKDEDITGKKLKDAIPELKTQGFYEILQSVFETGKPYKSIKQIVVFEKKGKFNEGFYNIIFTPVISESTHRISGISIVMTEVSRQVYDERRLLDAEKKIQHLISNNLYMTCIFSGEEMLIEMANEAVISIINKGRNIIGRKLKYLLPEIIDQPFYQNYLITLKEGRPIDIMGLKVERIINGKKRASYYNTSFRIIPNFETGVSDSVLITCINVTDLFLAQKKAHENEILLKHFIENVPVAINVCEGENFEYKISNQISEKVWGYRPVIGSFVKDTVPGIEERPIYKDLLKAFHEGIQISRKEHEFKDQYNKKQYINYIFQPIRDDDGVVKYVMTLGYDVSEELEIKKRLRENEKKFKTLAEFMPQIVWTADKHGNATYFNQNWYLYTQFPKDSDPNENLKNILNPQMVDDVLETWKDCLKNEKPYEIEYQFKDPGNPGSYRWFLARAIPVYNENMEVEMWIGTCTDINEFKELQNQKDIFLAIASHELKTPLTSLKLYAQYLANNLKKTGDEKNETTAKKIDEQVNKLNALVGELLDVTKIQKDKMSLHISEFNFDDLVIDIIEEQKMASNHKIIFNGEKVGNIRGDRNRISQVMSNLINNAVKYSPNAREIIVSTAAMKDTVKFSVRDFGIGIPKENLKHVFDQFYRVNGDKEHTISGLGLGLYISSEIIKRSNGKIFVSSERGKGSVFGFELPASKHIIQEQNS